MTTLTIAITPAGMSPLRCVCGLQLSTEMAKALETNLIMCSCGHTMFDFFCCEISINPDCAHLLDDEAAFTTTWYHLTDKANWANDTLLDLGQDSVMVHLGTLDAALEHEIGAYPGRRGDLYLYEVRIVAGAPLSPDLHKDDDVWPETAGECAEYDFTPGVHRYANAVESTGSISLLADARYVEVLACHVL